MPNEDLVTAQALAPELLKHLETDIILRLALLRWQNEDTNEKRHAFHLEMIVRSAKPLPYYYHIVTKDGEAPALSIQRPEMKCLSQQNGTPFPEPEHSLHKPLGEWARRARTLQEGWEAWCVPTAHACFVRNNGVTLLRDIKDPLWADYLGVMNERFEAYAETLRHITELAPTYSNNVRLSTFRFARLRFCEIATKARSDRIAALLGD